MDPLGDHLPPEVRSYLFSFFSGTELADLSLVATHWAATAKDEINWKNLCKRQFGVEDKHKKYATWKELYIARWKALQKLKKITLTDLDVSSKFLTFSEDKLSIHHSGFPDNEDINWVGAVQATESIQIIPFGDRCFIGYFEVQVENTGELGSIGVGVGLNGFPKGRGHPGWIKGSFGYHGDDGCLFQGTGYGSNWGPTYGAGDVVGCGLNFKTKELFWTKNGELVGVPKLTLNMIQHCCLYYPIMGLHSHGEKIHINFGRKPFVFDIAAYIAALRAGKEVPCLVKPAPKKAKEDGDGDEGEENEEQEQEKEQEKKKEDKDKEKEKEQEKEEDDIYVEEKKEDVDEAKERDWELERDISPLERIMERINQPGAEHDEDLIEYIRTMLRHEYFKPVSSHIDAETATVEEMFDVCRRLGTWIEDRKMWEDYPEEEVPQETKTEIMNIQYVISVLMDKGLPSTSQQITQLIGLFAASNVDLGNGDDDSKRSRLMLELIAIVANYGVALLKRDIMILENTKYPNDHFKIKRILNGWAESLDRNGIDMGETLSEMRETTLRFLKTSLVEDDAELRAIKQSLEAIKKAEASGGTPVVTWGPKTATGGGGNEREGDEREKESEEDEVERSMRRRRWLSVGLALFGIGLIGFGAYKFFGRGK